MSEQLASGVTITFASGFFGRILDLDFDETTRPVIKKTSHAEAATGFDLFVPGAIVDAGGATIELQHDGTKVVPISSPAETITFAYPDGTGFEVSGFMDRYKPKAPLEGMLGATAHLKFSGAPTPDNTPT